MRDYKKNPLKFKEKIPKEEIYDLYINKNYSRSMLQEYFNVGRTKIRQTLKFYNIEKPKNLRQQAYKNSCIKKYGEEHPRKDEHKNKQIIEKIKNTNIEKYGTEFASQSIVIKEKTKQTLLNKYGTTAIQKIPEIKEKSKQTILEKYGVEHVSKNQEIVKKQWEGKKKHGTTNTSKAEKYIKQKLLEIFKEVKTNYKCEKYPFHCDFYIPEQDLFIEYQGFEGHGKEPFDHTNPQHLTILKIWVEKAEKKPYNKSNKYLAYLKTWIKTDVLKRQIAKQNNLNWIEFFTVEQFDNWITKKDTSV